MDDADDLRWLSTGDLTGAVRKLTGDDAARVLGWTFDQLVGGAGEGIGVWRLAGDGILRGTPGRWSIVLKGWRASLADTAPSAFLWPDREVVLYGSGLLADLPGDIRAPACFGTFTREDGSSWAWLEDITTRCSPPESKDDYTTVARSLGRFNGAYLNGTPLPQHPGLSEQWLRQWVEATGPSLSLLERDDDPFMRQVYPPHITEVFLRLWTSRDALLRQIEQLPPTLCHMDVFRRNAFLRRDVVAPGGAILIDWSFTGIGHLGEDLVPLIAASAIFMEIPIDALDDLYEATLAAYLEGLRDAGWRGDEGAIRDACLIATALRYGLGTIRVIAPLLLDHRSHARVERMFGHPFAKVAATSEAVHTWITRKIDECADLFGVA